MKPRAAALTMCALALLLTPGCLGTSTNNRCVDNASSSGTTATIQAEGATFQYADPSGLVNANWDGRGMYTITVENNVITQTLKAFTRTGNCPLIG